MLIYLWATARSQLVPQSLSWVDVDTQFVNRIHHSNSSSGVSSAEINMSASTEFVNFCRLQTNNRSVHIQFPYSVQGTFGRGRNKRLCKGRKFFMAVEFFGFLLK